MTSPTSHDPSATLAAGPGPARRTAAAWGALLLALLVGVLALAPQAHAADRNFGTRFATNDTGDIDIFGNTLMTCPAAAAGCAAAQQSGVTTTTDASSQNNAYNMQYVDVDGDSTTFDSSRSTVSLPTGSTVLFAGLYWGARTAAGTGGSAARTVADRNKVKFKVPGATAYTALTADTLDDGTGGIYQGFEDVTTQVKAAGSGVYTVADVQASTGADTLAGWSLVIAYRDTTQPARNLSVFDGIKSISSGASGSIAVSGFTTPPAGAVKTHVGFVTYEGDGGIVGDSASLNGTTLSDAQHPATNFFNSRSSRDGVRRTATDPNYPNQLGIEQSILTANGILGNGATSATIGLTSSGDVYAPGVVTFATDLYAPKVEQTKTVANVTPGKTAGSPVEQGDTLRYTISGSNTGQDGATNFVLRDPIPANTVYKAGSLKLTPVTGGAATAAVAATDAAGDDRGEYDATNRRVVARLGAGSTATAGGTLAVNATYAATFDVTVGGPSPSIASGTDIVNTATSSFASQSLGTALTAESSATATVTSPDLTITKTGQGTIVRGQTYDYAVAVKNDGDAKTQGTVTVTDTLPTGLTAVSASGSGWSCTVATGAFTCTRSDVLAAGSSYPAIALRTNVAADAPSPIANTASVAGGGDGDLTNNTATATSGATSSADLSITKTADASSIAVGGAVTYTLKVQNAGPSRSGGSVITDALPAGLTYVSSDAACTGSAASSSVSCAVGALASGASTTFTVVAKPAVGTAGTTLRNTATVTGNDPDPTAGNNTSDASVAVKPVDLAVTNTVQGSPTSIDAGGSAVWLVDVKNLGGSPASGSTVSFPVPAGTTVGSALDSRCTVASGVITCNLGTVAAGASVPQIQIPLTVAAGSGAPASIATLATVKSVETDADTGNNSAATSTPVKSAVDLGVTLAADPGTTSAGENLKLTATVRNNGPATPATPTVTISVPTGTTFVSADAGCAANAGGTAVVCTLTGSELTSGASVTRSIVVKAGSDLGASVSATATVATSSPDTDRSNDTAAVAVPVVRLAGLSITKTASTTQAKPGDAVVYTLTATNAGPGSSQDSVVTDTLPAGTTFVSADAADCTAAAGTITCDFGTIAAGAGRTAKVTVSVDPIASAFDASANHQYVVVKQENTLDVPAGSTGTVTASCAPLGSDYVATDGSVLLKSTDQDQGSFGDVRVTESHATADGTGWTGTARNTTGGQLQATVNVVCIRRTVEVAASHTHALIISDPIVATRGSGRQDVVLSCGAGRVAITPGWTFQDGVGRVLTSRAEGSDWHFTVDASQAAGVQLEVRCLSTTTTVANGHAHDLVLTPQTKTVDIRPSASTNDKISQTLSCTDGKGIVASTSYDPQTVALGNEAQPVSRVFSFYNPTTSTQTADIGLLCLGTRTSGEIPVKDITNTASVTTTTPDASTADNTSTAVFRATAASGPVDPTPTPAPAAPAAAAAAPAATPVLTAAAPAPTSSAVAAPVLRASVLSTALRVTGTTSKATVALPVRCAKACTASATLSALSAVKGTSIKKGSVLAKVAVKLKAGKKTTIRLVAKGAAARALKRGGVKRARITVRTGKGTVTKTVRIVLR